MNKSLLIGLASSLIGTFTWVGPGFAGELLTSIDLGYLYGQKNVAGDVQAEVTYTRQFEVRYSANLTSTFDLSAAAKIALDDSWALNRAHVDRAAPTLEMELKGSQSTARVSYQEILSTTDAFRESSEVEAYSNNLDVTMQLLPEFWPEIQLKLLRQHDLQPQSNDKLARTMELQTRKDIFGVRLELLLKRSFDDSLMPAQRRVETTDWSGKATYREVLYGGTEFELAYEIKESYSETRLREIFTGMSGQYTQSVKTRLKNSLVMTPRLTIGVAWDYGYEEDLLVLDKDYQVKNKYELTLRYDMFTAFKLTGTAVRETDLTVNPPGEDELSAVSDTLRATGDFSPVSWLRITGKAEYKNKSAIKNNTGGSVSINTDEKYELIARNRFGEFWDLALNGTTALSRREGWLVKRETRLKADLRLQYLGFGLQPSAEAGRVTQWQEAVEKPDQERSDRQIKLKFDYKLQLAELLTTTFSHEYGLKLEEGVDNTANYGRLLQMNEDTRLTLVLSELIRDYLRLEGEIYRKGTDTEGDADPQLVEIAYSLKLNVKYEKLSLTSGFTYNDKGNTFDDTTFNTVFGWKDDFLEFSGDYTFSQIYSEETDQTRKLSLKINYKF